MSSFVESLKRLYSQGKIADVKLDELKAKGKLTDEEYSYIKGGEE